MGYPDRNDVPGAVKYALQAEKADPSNLPNVMHTLLRLQDDPAELLEALKIARAK